VKSSQICEQEWDITDICMCEHIFFIRKKLSFCKHMRISEDGSLLLLLLLSCRLNRVASEQPTTLSSLSGEQEDEEAAADLSSVITRAKVTYVEAIP
jgi:hypothetical protein